MGSALQQMCWGCGHTRPRTSAITVLTLSGNHASSRSGRRASNCRLPSSPRCGAISISMAHRSSIGNVAWMFAEVRPMSWRTVLALPKWTAAQFELASGKSPKTPISTIAGGAAAEAACALGKTASALVIAGLSSVLDATGALIGGGSALSFPRSDTADPD